MRENIFIYRRINEEFNENNQSTIVVVVSSSHVVRSHICLSMASVDVLISSLRYLSSPGLHISAPFDLLPFTYSRTQSYFLFAEGVTSITRTLIHTKWRFLV